MSPLFVKAESRECDAPADRRTALRKILILADELIYSEGSTTSRYFDRWCEIRRNADRYLEMLETADELIDYFLPMADAQLRNYFLDEPEE